MIDEMAPLGETSLGELLHRHRIQIGALVGANPELARLAVDLADAASRPARGTDALERFLQTLSAYGSPDVRSDLRLALAALGSR